MSTTATHGNKSTMLKDIKPHGLVNNSNANMHNHHGHHHNHNHNVPPPDAADAVVNEVLSEIASEQSQETRSQPHHHSSPPPATPSDMEAQKMQHILMQQQMMLQHLQHQLYQQSNAESSHEPTDDIKVDGSVHHRASGGSAKPEGPQKPYYKLVGDEIHRMIISNNNLMIKSTIIYLVFQYIDVMSIVMGSTKILKIDHLFAVLANSAVLSNFVKSIVFGIILVIVHSLI